VWWQPHDKAMSFSFLLFLLFFIYTDELAVRGFGYWLANWQWLGLYLKKVIVETFGQLAFRLHRVGLSNLGRANYRTKRRLALKKLLLRFQFNCRIYNSWTVSLLVI